MFVILTNLLPVWLFRYFPSQDGPSHVYNSWIIANWDRPEGAIYRHYYELNTRPEPNWLSHAALAGLMRAGVPPLVAEKIFITLFIALLAGGMWHAIGAVAPEARLLAALALPVAVGWPLGMGFYNYCLGLAGFLWVFGWWYRRRGDMRPARIAILAAMGVALYFTHMVAIGGVIAAIGTVALCEALAERPAGPALKRLLFPVVLAFVPAVALALAFVAGSAGQGRMPLWLLGSWRLAPFLTLQSLLVCYSSAEMIPSTIMALALVAAVVLILLERKKSAGVPPSGGILDTKKDGLLAAALVFVFLYFTAPHEASGGTYVFRRLAPFVVFMLVLWFAANSDRRLIVRPLAALGVAIALVFAVMRLAQISRLNDYIAEYVSVGESIEAPATVLPLCLSPRGTDEDGFFLSLEIWPFSHASGYMAAGRPIVDLSDYEGAMGYFPLLWRPGLNPFTRIEGEIFDDPFHLVFSGYERNTSGMGRIDYVLVWSDPRHPPPPRLTDPIARQLAAGYTPVATSKPRGYATLWARR
ncbi:MAG: hypothetical protein ABFD69_02700 [Candidatus Sumerlaeia bacterium]